MSVRIGLKVCQKKSEKLMKSQKEKQRNACGEQKEPICTKRISKMSGDFIGTIPDNAVHKSRIMIPAKFKKKFAPEANGTVVVTLGPKGTIAIFPMDSWFAMRAQLQTRQDKKSKQLQANLFDFAMPEQSLEGPGRIRISDELMLIAKIRESVSIKGEGHFMSVWNAETLRTLKQQQSEDHIENYDSTDYQINVIS